MSCTFKNEAAPSGLSRVGWSMGCYIKFNLKNLEAN